MSKALRASSVLVCINGNVPEWRASFSPMAEVPRLPLPYAFGVGLASQGLALSAYDFSAKSPPEDIAPFVRYFARGNFGSARASEDFAVLWGTSGIGSCLSEAIVPHHRRKTILFCYGWRPTGHTSMARRGILTITRRAAHLARCVILMTTQQVAAARSDLPARVPVIQLRVGIDTLYYARPSSEADVPEEHRASVEALLREPYMILPGDELRINDDALEVAQATGIRLVRISQYNHKSGTNALKEKVARLGLGERVIVFERISYAFLRYLLQHAAAYAGFVDASWQPAGWTVACESLASGLPLVLYDGLTSREMAAQGCNRNLMRVVTPGDRDAFSRELVSLVAGSRSAEQIAAARQFAARTLDFEVTAQEFSRKLVVALGVSA